MIVELMNLNRKVFSHESIILPFCFTESKSRGVHCARIIGNTAASGCKLIFQMENLVLPLCLPLDLDFAVAEAVAIL